MKQEKRLRRVMSFAHISLAWKESFLDASCQSSRQDAKKGKLSCRNKKENPAVLFLRASS